MTLLPGRVLRAAVMVFLGGLPACSHPRSVEKLEGRDRGATSDPRGRPEVPLNPEHPLVVEAPAKLLRPGAGRHIQEALRRKGILTQPDDEALGEATSDAIARLQRDNDLAATGFPDAETLKVLGLEPGEVYRSPPDEAETEKLKRKLESEARQKAADDERLEEKGEKETEARE
jgi:hypothetical protein